VHLSPIRTARQPPLTPPRSGAYHTNPVNVGIHIVGVPTIIFGAQVMLASRGPLEVPAWLAPALDSVKAHAPAALAKYAQFDAAAVFASAYWVYYFLLDSVAAVRHPAMLPLLLALTPAMAQTALLPLWAGLYFGAQYLLAEHADVALKYGLYAFAAGWISQFYGHGVHEGRAPAVSVTRERGAAGGRKDVERGVPSNRWAGQSWTLQQSGPGSPWDYARMQTLTLPRLRFAAARQPARRRRPGALLRLA
jgi:uncharacterized membrane protein YGL010W